MTIKTGYKTRYRYKYCIDKVMIGKVISYQKFRNA